MSHQDQLTEGEMEVVMRVFKQFETGLREATILPRVGFRKQERDVLQERKESIFKYLNLFLTI